LVNSNFKTTDKKKHNKAKLHHHPEDWQQFKGFQHQVHSLMCRQHWQYLSNILTTTDEIVNKLLWHYIKHRWQDKIDIGILNNSNGTLVTDSVKKSLTFE